jgi:Holliday junction resolvase RusA-like endonuclease
VSRAKAKIALPSPLVGAPVDHGYLLLTGAPPSLNNMFVNLRGQRGGRFKSAAYLQWIQTSAMQLRQQQPWHVPGKTRVWLDFDRRQTGADLDNLVKAVLDLLVAYGRIEDDSNVIELHARFDDEALGTEITVASEHWMAEAA